MAHTTSGQRITLLIIVLSALFGLSGLISLALLKVMMSAGLPLRNFAADISNINDLAVLKNLCVPIADELFRTMNASRASSKWAPLLVAISGFLCCSVGVCLYRQLERDKLAQRVEDAQLQGARRSFMEQALSGELKLWKAFWFLYVPAPLIAALSFSLLMNLGTRLGVADSFGFSIFIFLPILMAAIFVINISAAVFTWRCAANTSHIFWYYAARGVIVICTIVPLAQAALLLWDMII